MEQVWYEEEYAIIDGKPHTATAWYCWLTGTLRVDIDVTGEPGTHRAFTVIPGRDRDSRAVVARTIIEMLNAFKEGKLS